MTTKNFAKYIEKQCKGINNFSLEALFGEYVVLVSGKRVGVIYQEKFHVLYAPTFENAEIVIPDFKVINLFDWKYYSFVEIKENAVNLLLNFFFFYFSRLRTSVVFWKTWNSRTSIIFI